jgi:hypothetical protein
MRKAQTQSTIITLILFFVVAVLLVIFAGRLTSLLNESRATEVCKASMLASSTVKIVGIQGLSIKCKMQVFDIKADGVYQNQKKIKKFPAENLDIETEVKRVVADRIADCWQMASEGKVNPFGEWSKNILSKPNLCVLCSKINFDKNLGGKINTQFNLTKWYNETKMLGKETTYSQYAPVKFEDSLDIQQEYYIVYSVATYSKWRTIIKWVVGSGGLVGHIITKTVLNSEETPGIKELIKSNPFTPSLFILTPENVQNVCQQIAN